MRRGTDPVRGTLLPYARQIISDDDVGAVTEVLRSDWLTTGPMVARFESAFAKAVGAAEAVAFCNGTAALHGMVDALGLQQGDEVIVPTMTFAATANVVVFEGAHPVFVDVDPATLLIDPAAVRSALTNNTKAIIAVDFAGQPCDYAALRAVAEEAGVPLLADGAHALGAAGFDKQVGAIADATAFSFHPAKHITTGEGGMVTTDDAEWADHMRRFRNHGINIDHQDRAATASFRYDIPRLGYNYRLTDLQCALGLRQLDRLREWIGIRRSLAARYRKELATLPGVTPLEERPDRDHAYHLFIVRIDPTVYGMDRDTLFPLLRADGIGANVHYLPVHLFTYYQKVHQTRPGQCPVAEAAYEQILSLPMHAAMTAADVDDVVFALKKHCRAVP